MRPALCITIIKIIQLFNYIELYLSIIRPDIMIYYVHYKAYYHYENYAAAALYYIIKIYMSIIRPTIIIIIIIIMYSLKPKIMNYHYEI